MGHPTKPNVLDHVIRAPLHALGRILLCLFVLAMAMCGLAFADGPQGVVRTSSFWTGRSYFPNAVTFGSTVTFNGNVTFTGTVTGAGGGIPTNTVQTPDASFAEGLAVSNNYIFAEVGDNAFDFAHAQSTTPTIFVHSAAQSTTQWMSLAHNGSNGRIDTGVGDVDIYTAGTHRAAFQGDILYLIGGTTPSLVLGQGTYDTGIKRSAANTLDVTNGTAGAVTGILRTGSAQWVDPGSKPTCDASNRGKVFYNAGGAGVPDTFEVCVKPTTDVYAWLPLATIP